MCGGKGNGKGKKEFGWFISGRKVWSCTEGWPEIEGKEAPEGRYSKIGFHFFFLLFSSVYVYIYIYIYIYVREKERERHLLPLKFKSK